ncbi:MAG: hypothetical protein ABSG65_01620 [Bryobacteraceae bacterium]
MAPDEAARNVRAPTAARYEQIGENIFAVEAQKGSRIDERIDLAKTDWGFKPPQKAAAGKIARPISKNA